MSIYYKKIFYNLNIKIILLSILFIIYLNPFSINLGGDGLSANYIFILFPIFIIFITSKIKIPPVIFNFYIFVYMFIFFLVVFFQITSDVYFLRRSISFLIFMSIFSYLLINIDKDMIKAFKIALVLLSVFKASTVVYLYFIYDLHLLGPKAKGIIGGQRFGFIYLMSFWLIVFYQAKSTIFRILKYIFIFILLSGLLLTFARSSVASLFLSIMFFAFFQIKIKNKISKKKLKKLIITFFTTVIIFYFLIINYPSVFSFYNLRIIDFLVEGGFYQEFVDSNPKKSLGFRVFIFNEVLNYLSENLFTGSGYLGCWILFEDQSCSAHSQYLDVIFRTGFIGFLIYIFILYKILKFLYFNHQDLFYGFFGILIYGFFHETFKLSHGGFVLAFLLGMVFTNNSNKNLLKKNF